MPVQAPVPGQAEDLAAAPLKLPKETELLSQGSGRLSASFGTCFDGGSSTCTSTSTGGGEDLPARSGGAERSTSDSRLGENMPG